jgi:hypothetical protein
VKLVGFPVAAVCDRREKADSSPRTGSRVRNDDEPAFCSSLQRRDWRGKTVRGELPVVKLIEGGRAMQAQYDSELARREFAGINKPQVEKVPGPIVGWSFPPPVPVVQEIALGLNAPAAMAGVLLALLIGYETNLFMTGSCAIFVLVLWYLIGRELDRRRGLLPAKPVLRPGILRKVRVSLDLFLCALLAALFLRQFMFGHHGRDYYALSLGLWLGLAAYVLWRTLRRWRSPSNTPSELRISS